MSDNTTLIDNLNSIKNSKADIKQALIDKGQQATDVLATYADLIEDIETGIDTSDATATASDIKEGKTAYVDGEKITGIYVDEDLTNVLDAQDEKIAELEATLENKTAGGEVKPNIFVQPTEPINKRGIWFQRQAVDVENYYGDNDVYIEGEWETNTNYQSITRYRASLTIYENTVYIIGGYLSSSTSNPVKTCTKYDILENTVTNLTDLPEATALSGFVADNSGEYLYVFGGITSSIQTRAYRYSISQNTWTRLADCPYTTYGGYAFMIDDDNICVCGNSNIYKYTISTNSYSNIMSGNASGNYIKTTHIGNDIYSIDDTKLTKFNIETKTSLVLSTIPYSATGYCQVTSYGTDVYIFGGASSSRLTAYKYNTLTDTYTKLTNIPSSGRYSGCACVWNNRILLITGEYITTHSYIVNTKTYETNSVILSSGIYTDPAHLVEIFSFNKAIEPIMVGVQDAWYYGEDGLELSVPTYYGDGTQWIKFKN